VIFHSYVSSFTRPGNCGVSADLCKTMSAGWIEDERFGFRQSPSFQEGSQGGGPKPLGWVKPWACGQYFMKDWDMLG
jgi:hypothetical protein